MSAIYKTTNTEKGNGMRGMWGTWGMLTTNPDNFLRNSGDRYYFKIPGMLKKVPGNVS